MTSPDRARGALVGLAAGDRIGGPLRMALCLADSLVSQHAFDPADVLARYVAWWRLGGFDTGPVAEGVFRRVAQGTSAKEAVRQVDAEMGGLTAGCNPAHRVAPLAMAAFLPEDALAATAAREAALTHAHALAGDVAAAVVVLCRMLIRGRDWSQGLRLASAGRQLPTQEALARAAEAPVDRGGFSPTVLHAAVHFAATRPSFTAALTDALEFAGPANYCPVLAGVLAGARFGAPAILPIHLRHVDILARVRLLVDALAHGW